MNENHGEEPMISSKVTRRSFTAVNVTETCFFCDEENELHSYRTKNLSKHVHSWATYLCDTKLLAKFSEGDKVATEAVYNKNCLTKLYNQFKSKKKEEHQNLKS